MIDLARLYARIALLRSGPQDVPASALLLALTTLAYALANATGNWLVPPKDAPWPAMLAVDVTFTLCWYGLLLRVVRKPERFLQTTTAVFGLRTLVAPLVIASGALLRRFGEAGMWQLPVWALSMALAVWVIAANSHVLKAALEWTIPACVGLVILEMIGNELLQLSLLPLSH